MSLSHGEIADVLASQGDQTIASEAELVDRFGENADGVKNITVIIDLLKERGFDVTRASGPRGFCIRKAI